jgi:tetratricopeptide (TPR) repeat protein
MRNREPPDLFAAEQSGDDELWLLFTASARKLVNSPDHQSFLDWIADAGPALAPGLAAQIDPRTGAISDAFRSIGLEIYRAMPLPANNFRRPTVSKPGRNEPCPCGSGRKYKQCCQASEGLFDLRQFNLLPFVLDALPRKQVTTLPDSDVDIEMVADSAGQLLEKGETRSAVQLLEPWFGAKRKLSGKLEQLFDQLMDCYLELNKSRKRKSLLEDVLARGDRTLRATALHRRASIEADSGDYAAAWTTVEEARRLDPDNVALAPLEITLLMTQGNTSQAQERARFWSARLRRSPNAEFAPMIEFLNEVVNDPDKAMSGLARERDPALDVFTELLLSAPPVAPHYALDGERDTFLVPDRRLIAVEKTWHQVFPQVKPGLTALHHQDPGVWNSAPDWLPILESSPYAWQSFDILDDLILAVDALQIPGLDVTLKEPLLNRGAELLEANLEESVSQDVLLPWGFQQNRPALRILAHRAFLAMERLMDYSGELVTARPAELLLALNPVDNHGLRAPLARAYIACGQPAKALELCDRYPDDFCGMTLNRILALHRLGRLDEALESLRLSADSIREAAKMLLAANPRKPKLSEFSVTLGGKDEAWYYRQDHLSLWQQQGALDWLRQAHKTL